VPEGFKIATGRVEIKVDYDSNKIRSKAAQVGTSSGNAFSKAFNRRVEQQTEKNFFLEKRQKEYFKRSSRIGRSVGAHFADGFTKRTNKKLQSDVEWKQFEKRATRATGAAGKRSGLSFFSQFAAQMNTGTKNWSSQWGKTMNMTAQSTAGDFSETFGRVHRKTSIPQAKRAGITYGNTFGKALSAAVSPIIVKQFDLARLFSGITAAVGLVGGSVGQLVTMSGLISVLASSVAVLAGGFVELAGEASQALTVIAGFPAALSSVITSFGVLTLATDNFREAIFGTGEEAEKALGIIAEQAPGVADSIRSMRDQARSFQDAAEAAFLGEIQSGMRALSNDLLPELETGIADVAEAWGVTTNKTLEFLGTRQSIEFFNDLLESTAQQIRNGSDVLPNLTAGFMSLAGAGLPAMEDFATWLNEITGGFREWAAESAETGKVNEWIREGAATLMELGSILKNIISIMWSVLEVAGEGGLLGKIDSLTESFAEFLNTAEGMQSIRSIFDGINQQAEALAPVFEEILNGVVVLAPAFADLTTAISPAFASMVRILVDSLNEINPGMVSVAEALSDTWMQLESSGALTRIASAIGKMLEAVANWMPVVSNALTIILTALGLAADGFANIISPIVEFVTQSKAMQVILGVLAVALTAILLPGVASVKLAILGVIAVLAVFSDDMAAVRPYILAIVGVITAFLLPGLAYMSQAFIAARIASVSAWVAKSVAATVHGAKIVATLVGISLQYWKTAAAATKTAAIAVGAWIRKQVAAVAAAVIINSANRSIGRGMLLTAGQSLVAGARMAIAWTLALGPIGWVIAGVVAVIAIIAVLWKKSETFRKIVTGAWEKIKEAAKSFMDWFNANLKPQLMEGWNNLKEALQPLIDKFQEFVSFFKSEGASFGDQMVEAFATIRGAIQPFLDWLSGIWDKHGDEIISFVQIVGKFLGSVLLGYFKFMVGFVRAQLDVAIGVIAGAFRAISGIIIGVLDVIMGLYKVFKGIFTGDWKMIWEGVKQIFAGVWAAIEGIVVGAFEILKGVVKAGVRLIAAIIGAFGGDANAAFAAMWGSITKWFQKGWDWVVGIMTGLRDWIIGVWDWIYNILVGNSIVPDLVNAIFTWFQNMSTWVLGILNGFKNFVIGVFTWIWNNVIMGVVNFVRMIIAKIAAFVAKVIVTFVTLQLRAIAVWKHIILTIRNIIFSWIKWVIANILRIVNWVVARFIWFRNRALMVWRLIVNSIRNLINGWINWVNGNIQKLIIWFIARFIFFRNRAYAIWNLIVKRIRSLIQGWINWVRTNILKIVNWFIDRFSHLRNRAVSIWNNIRHRIIDVIQKFRNTAMNVINGFKDRVINAFEKAKDGVGKAWRKLRDVAKAPVKFVINTVYNNGIVPLWNKVAKKVPGLSELNEFHPRGFATGGILPGQSTFRQGDDQLVPMRKGEGVYVSEAMRDPYERARLFAVNKAAMQGKDLRQFRDGAFPGQRGIFPGQYTAQKKLNRQTTDSGPKLPPGIGFARGGILGAIKQKWDDISGGLKKWAMKPLNGLKDQIASRFSTGDNWEGIPYKMVTAFIPKMLKKFADISSKFGGLGGKGQAGDVIRKANSFVGRVSGRPNQFSNAMGMPFGPWCAAFISEVFRMVKATGSIRGITARNGGAAVATFNSKLKRVPHSQRRAGDLPTYRGSGHINLLANRNTTIGGNESDAVRKQSGYVNSATAILRPDYKDAKALGGIIGSKPMGRGSHDIGGMVPDRHLAYNRSGQAELMQTLDQIKAMAALIEGKGDTFNIDKIEINPDSIEKLQKIMDLFDQFKRAARADGGKVRYKIRD
jgi:phage-related protein